MNGFMIVINPDSHGEHFVTDSWLVDSKMQLEFTDDPWQAESIFDEVWALWVFETLIDAG